MAASALAAYGYGRSRTGTDAAASGFAFLSLTTSQLLYALRHASGSSSRLPGPLLLATLGGSFVLELAALGVPALRRLLGITQPRGVDLAVLSATSLVPMVVTRR